MNDHATPGNSDQDSTPLERALRGRRRVEQPDLDPDDREIYDDLLPWMDAVQSAAEQMAVERSGHADTPLTEIRADDPIALMLGLVPDPAVFVDGRKLALVRKKAGLDLGQLADRLRTRGWDVTVRQASRWELRQESLAPALVRAIAEELSASEGSFLTTGTTATTHGFDEVFDDDSIRSFIAEWAAEHHADPAHVRQRAMQTLVGAANRNRTTGSVRAVLDILSALRAIPDFLDQP